MLADLDRAHFKRVRRQRRIRTNRTDLELKIFHVALDGPRRFKRLNKGGAAEFSTILHRICSWLR